MHFQNTFPDYLKAFLFFESRKIKIVQTYWRNKSENGIKSSKIERSGLHLEANHLDFSQHRCFTTCLYQPTNSIKNTTENKAAYRCVKSPYTSSSMRVSSCSVDRSFSALCRTFGIGQWVQSLLYPTGIGLLDIRNTIWLHFDKESITPHKNLSKNPFLKPRFFPRHS